MKIRELIEALSNQPPEREIVIDDGLIEYPMELDLHGCSESSPVVLKIERPIDS
jgi:hypothetical protein